jgi:hypothetical protein
MAKGKEVENLVSVLNFVFGGVHYDEIMMTLEWLHFEVNVGTVAFSLNDLQNLTVSLKGNSQALLGR